MKKWLLPVLKIVKYAAIIFFASSIFMVLLYKFVNPPVTPLMVIRSSQQLFDGQSMKFKKDWVSIGDISPDLPLAVIASEDNRFMEHHGFDLDAIEKAKEYNERKGGKRVRGASTISQQTAKNVFLWPQRSWVRKGFEVYFTVLIEFFWSKKRILEVYLNVVEMGKGIYGAQAAAETYFGKPASKLSRGESALIAACLPSPLKSNPSSPSGYLIGRQQWILWNMGNIGKISIYD
ncbi:MAG: monofunctional biosynthetic peptidoglycan transglycosylase [bacterium]